MTTFLPCTFFSSPPIPLFLFFVSFSVSSVSFYFTFCRVFYHSITRPMFLNFLPCKFALTLSILSLAPSGDFKHSLTIFHIPPPPHWCLFPRTVSAFSKELGPQPCLPKSISLKQGLSGLLCHFLLLLAHPRDSNQWAGRGAPQKKDRETKSRCCQRLKKQWLPVWQPRSCQKKHGNSQISSAT